MFITPSFKKSLIVEQFQGNYLKLPGLSRNGALARVVRKMDNAIQRINHYPAVVCFANTYSLDNDLSDG